jgi:nucleotide-binding universal stress UspA family protein
MDGFLSILVHMDASPRSAARLELARTIAREQGAATLIALLALEPRPVPAVPDVLVGPKVYEVDPEKRQRARAIFDEALLSGDPPMTWAEVSGGAPVWGMTQASLYADLIVLGQYGPQDPWTPDVPNDFVESVVLESGKPALVIPYAGGFSTIGHNVLIAWKPTRECARAVAGAIPLMRRAQRVHAVSWGKENFEEAESTFGIVRYLRWHGIEATSKRYADVPDDLGAILLSHAADDACDLLVMGCYGHHRVRELLLGGGYADRAAVDDAAGVDGALTGFQAGFLSRRSTASNNACRVPMSVGLIR